MLSHTCCRPTMRVGALRVYESEQIRLKLAVLVMKCGMHMALSVTRMLYMQIAFLRGLVCVKCGESKWKEGWDAPRSGLWDEICTRC